MDYLREPNQINTMGIAALQRTHLLRGGAAAFSALHSAAMRSSSELKVSSSARGATRLQEHSQIN